MGIGMLFPGSGSQYIGMGRTFDCSRNSYFEIASEIGNVDIKKICTTGPMNKLFEPEYLHLAILTTSYVSYLDYREQNEVDVSVILGHSLGQYTALIASGAVSFEELAKVVSLRSKLVASVKGTSLLVSGISGNDLIEIITANELENIFISCINSPKEVMVSGEVSAVDLLLPILEAKGLPYFIQYNSQPIHSPLMNIIKTPFLKEIEKLTFSDFKIPVISNTTGNVFKSFGEIKEALGQHLVAPVLWSDSVESAVKLGATSFIEVAPNNILSRIGRQQNNEYPFLELDYAPSLFNSTNTKKEENDLAFIKNSLFKIATTKNLNKTISNEQYIQIIGNLYTKLVDLKKAVELDGKQLSKKERAELSDLMKEHNQIKQLSKEVSLG